VRAVKRHRVPHQDVLHQEYQHHAGLESDASDLVKRVARLEAGQPPPSGEHVLADFIPEAELVQQLQIGVRTLRGWRKKGKGPPVTEIGRKLYYRAKSVQDWLLSREKKAPRERSSRRQSTSREIRV
jgi:Helix-turn-helix domain